MKGKFFISILIFALIFIALAYWQLYAYNAPRPKYELLKIENDIEIRHYPELIVAGVTMPGDRYASINAGFRTLAGYIFGDNSKDQTIAMTAPVFQEKSNDRWVTRFIMPAGFKISTLPIPRNPAIQLSVIKSKKYIVIVFNGKNSDDNLEKHQQILLEYIKSNNIKTLGSPIIAFYNPPWILPILRRNEIMIELK